MTTTNGLCLGKYAPLHRGHQLVIETSLAEMDQTTVLIYDSPAVTSLPLPVRAAWLRRLYPTATVLEAWDGPQEVGYTPELMRRHEAYIVERLQGRQITHFYSSEPYGEHVSRALGAQNRQVDPQRLTVPVSATQIRANPWAYREYMAPLVYRDLVTTAVFLGAPATGKSTLAERLALDLGASWMPEYGREYWEAHQVNRRLSPAQLVELAEGHLQREEARWLQANRYLFVDTNALTTYVFCQYYHDAVPARLQELAAACASRYDLVFVCGDDIPYDDTWDRSGAGNRATLQQWTLGELRARRIPFILLTGDLATRVAKVKRILKRYQKYQNLGELAQCLTEEGH